MLLTFTEDPLNITIDAVHCFLPDGICFSLPKRTFPGKPGLCFLPGVFNFSDILLPGSFNPRVLFLFLGTDLLEE